MWGAILAITLAAGGDYTPIPQEQARAELRAAARLAAQEPSITITEKVYVVPHEIYTSSSSYSATSGAIREWGTGRPMVLSFSDGSVFSRLPRKERDAFRSYLAMPGLTWELLSQREQWAPERFHRMFLGSSFKWAAVATHNGSRKYRLLNKRKVIRVVISLDALGRPSTFEEWIKRAGQWDRIADSQVSYESVIITRPGPTNSLTQAELTPAREARDIPSTLIAIAAFTVNVEKRDNTLRALRHTVRGWVQVMNSVTESPEARVHWTRVRRGVRLYGHNQYTDQTFACRIVIRGGRWVVKPVRAGTWKSATGAAPTAR